MDDWEDYKRKARRADLTLIVVSIIALGVMIVAALGLSLTERTVWKSCLRTHSVDTCHRALNGH